MKRMLFTLICLIVALTLAACTTVNGNNSFQNDAPGEVSALPQVTDGQNANPTTAVTPETAPTSDPNASGFNG
jgi:ABC-type Zn uptake system ZnuABC Zn-binding protein ZnuA